MNFLGKIKILNKYILFILIGIIINFKVLNLKDIPAIIDFKTDLSTKDSVYYLNRLFLTFKFDSKAEEFHKFLDKSIQNFEIGELFSSKYMVSISENEKWLTYSGKWVGDNYTVFLKNEPYDELKIEKPYESKAYYSLILNKNIQNGKKIFKDDIYSGILKSNTNFHGFTNDKIISLLTNLLSYISYDNIKNLTFNINLSKGYKGKDKESEAIISNFKADFPNISKFILQYINIYKIITTYDDNKITKFSLVSEFNRNYLKIKFPYLTEYLEDISDLGFIEIIVKDLNAKNLITIYLNSKSSQLFLNFYTFNGKILPFTIESNKETYYMDSPISINELKDFPFIVQIKFKANIYGLRIKNDNIVLNGNYKKSDKDLLLELRFQEFPRCKIEGGFAYILPPSFINFVIPGNLEDLIYEFTSTLSSSVKKNKFISFQIQTIEKSARLKVDLNIDILNNFFIRFGLKVWNFKIQPSDMALDEIQEIFTIVTGELYKDLIQIP
jgi:hypothetical protein